MKIEITEEMYLNIKHCIERTKDMWKSEVDLWPFDLQHIVSEYETTKLNEQCTCKSFFKPANCPIHGNK